MLHLIRLILVIVNIILKLKNGGFLNGKHKKS